MTICMTRIANLEVSIYNFYLNFVIKTVPDLTLCGITAERIFFFFFLRGWTQFNILNSSSFLDAALPNTIRLPTGKSSQLAYPDACRVEFSAAHGTLWCLKLDIGNLITPELIIILAISVAFVVNLSLIIKAI